MSGFGAPNPGKDFYIFLLLMFATVGRSQSVNRSMS
jgi:hypothetical protein